MTSETGTPVLGSASEALLEFRVEAEGLDSRRCRSERWTATLATVGNDLVDVVASFGLLGQLLDELVIDGFPDIGCP